MEKVSNSKRVKAPSYVVGSPTADVRRNKEAIMNHFKEIMILCGIDPNTPDTKRTPERFWEVVTFATKGYDQEVSLGRTYEDCSNEDYPVLRISTSIPFTSMCEHHWLPFYGTIDIAYIPRGRVTGMSKLPQLVQKYAHRFQNQERMTEQIADELQGTLGPMGVMVISRATHTCEKIEGYNRDGPYVCSSVRGVFTKEINPRSETLALLENCKS